MTLSVVLRQGILVVLCFEKTDGAREGHPMGVSLASELSTGEMVFHGHLGASLLVMLSRKRGQMSATNR